METDMNWNHSLRRILGVAVWVVAASSSYAAPTRPCSDQNNHYKTARSPCEKKPDACCDDPRSGPFAFAYPMDVDLNCPRDFYVYCTGLALQAKQDGMAFAIRDSDGLGLPITNGTVLNFTGNNNDWDYNPGLRIGFGFYVHHDAWNIEFDWTWLNITNYKSFNAHNSGILIPLWSPPIAVSSSWTSCSASWNAHYNTLDAKLGKPYHVSRSLVLNPHFGIRAAWIDQNFSAHYGGTFGGLVNGTGAIHQGKNDFWGFGARTGVMSDWNLGKGWNLFGNIAAALLFGKFKVDQSIATGSSATNNGYALEEDFY
jgi:hypothetical protein